MSPIGLHTTVVDADFMWLNFSSLSLLWSGYQKLMQLTLSLKKHMSTDSNISGKCLAVLHVLQSYLLISSPQLRHKRSSL